MNTNELPALPEPDQKANDGVCCGNYTTGGEHLGQQETLCCGQLDERWPDYYTADQMREYARQALADRERQAGEAVAWREALHTAEAALADIGDADREPGDDVAWCEARAAQALPQVRAVLASLPAPQAVQAPRKLTIREFADLTAPWADVRSDKSMGIVEAAIMKFCEVNGIPAPSPDGKAEHVVTEHAPCKGMNCGITHTDQEHSLECQAEHAAAIAGGHFVKAEQAEAPSTVIHQHGFAADNNRLRVINESLDKQLEEVMAERDERDDVLGRIAGIIDAEFTSAYGFADLERDLEERLHAATQPTASNAEWRHIANEWADELCNAHAAICNVRDGIQSSQDAADFVQAGIDRCRALPRPTTASKPPQWEQKADGRLHADGYFTWNQGKRPAYIADRGLPCDFYLAPAQPEQVAQDKIDADRYRWLRDNNDDWEPFDGRWLSRVGCYGDDGPAMDASIDAASARGERGAKG